jgi:hypothetical protein
VLLESEEDLESEDEFFDSELGELELSDELSLFLFSEVSRERFRVP